MKTNKDEKEFERFLICVAATGIAVIALLLIFLNPSFNMGDVFGIL